MSKLTLITGAAVAAFTLIASSAASAAAVAYTLVPTASSITISGTAGGVTLAPQNGASTTTSYSGTILADRSAGSITFSGGSAISAALQPLNQAPKANGVAGTAPANYGFSITLPFVGSGQIAARNVVLDITSGALTVGGTGTITGTDNFAFTSGVADYNATIATGQQSFAGISGDNAAPAAATVTVAGGIETLTIPVFTTFTTTLITTDDTTLIATGTLVATRAVVVPEPTAITLIAAGLLSMPIRRRR